MLKLWPVLAQFTAPELWVQVEYLVRIFVAACLGLLSGSERKNRNKSAGIRTHVIVALGLSLIHISHSGAGAGTPIPSSCAALIFSIPFRTS